ncbi:MAG: VOC family protein [Actinomycetia bacterium]|nr:VOC family protein [Actinomycetes bacterium]
MQLGAFSVSLVVQDMAASREFYGKLGFAMVGGDGQTWTILLNGTTVIGLFHGMFEQNILTFNPGWQGAGEAAADFTDVRQLREDATQAGLPVTADTTQETPSGPASFMITDPDGNTILFDQHVD